MQIKDEPPIDANCNQFILRTTVAKIKKWFLVKLKNIQYLDRYFGAFSLYPGFPDVMFLAGIMLVRVTLGYRPF